MINEQIDSLYYPWVVLEPENNWTEADIEEDVGGKWETKGKLLKRAICGLLFHYSLPCCEHES